MNQHPAKTMLGVWGLCVAAFVLLPYQLLDRKLTTQGLVVLALFVACYVAGTLLVPTRRHLSNLTPLIRVDAAKVETLLRVAATLATVCYGLDATNKSIFDLEMAYEQRSGAADDLLKAGASNSSIWFQLAFLLYPAGYVFIAVHVLYALRVQLWKLAIFGFLPILLATLSMGGRNPIFYALILAWLVFKERGKVASHRRSVRQASKISKWLIILLWGGVFAALILFFSAVFVVRADAMGGSEKMFMHAEKEWGVGFRGPMSNLIFHMFGEDLAYLIFIFSWYLVQGFVISNYLFSSYDGPIQMGAYGIDLLSALMRRIDPDRLAEGFNSLLTLGTYGFLPSAWGSLYVDFGYFAVVFCVIWGAFTALCYRRIVVQCRNDWVLIGPFATLGIIFSIINTPLGYTNGLVTHAWLLGAFLLLRRPKLSKNSELIHTK